MGLLMMSVLRDWLWQRVKPMVVRCAVASPDVQALPPHHHLGSLLSSLWSYFLISYVRKLLLDSQDPCNKLCVCVKTHNRFVTYLKGRVLEGETE